MPQSDWVHLDGCKILATTASAILVRYDGEKHWFPRTHVLEGEDMEAGEDEDLTISITEWIADQKGIEV